jgi:hypothetical protein
MAPNGMTTSVYWIGRDMKGNGSDLFQGTVPTLYCPQNEGHTGVPCVPTFSGPVTVEHKSENRTEQSPLGFLNYLGGVGEVLFTLAQNLIA